MFFARYHSSAFQSGFKTSRLIQWRRGWLTRPTFVGILPQADACGMEKRFEESDMLCNGSDYAIHLASGQHLHCSTNPPHLHQWLYHICLLIVVARAIRLGNLPCCLVSSVRKSHGRRWLHSSWVGSNYRCGGRETHLTLRP